MNFTKRKSQSSKWPHTETTHKWLRTIPEIQNIQLTECNLTYDGGMNNKTDNEKIIKDKNGDETSKFIINI